VGRKTLRSGWVRLPALGSETATKTTCGVASQLHTTNALVWSPPRKNTPDWSSKTCEQLNHDRSEHNGTLKTFAAAELLTSTPSSSVLADTQGTRTAHAATRPRVGSTEISSPDTTNTDPSSFENRGFCDGGNRGRGQHARYSFGSKRIIKKHKPHMSETCA